MGSSAVAICLCLFKVAKKLVTKTRQARTDLYLTLKCCFSHEMCVTCLYQTEPVMYKERFLTL